MNGKGFAYFNWRCYSGEYCDDDGRSCDACDTIWRGMQS